MKLTEKQTEIVSEAEWLVARKDLLTREKEFSRQRDALTAARRKLPMVKIEKEYVFEGPNGKETLADLFEGRSQLIFIISCSARAGRRVARAARIWPIILTGLTG